MSLCSHFIWGNKFVFILLLLPHYRIIHIKYCCTALFQQLFNIQSVSTYIHFSYIYTYNTLIRKPWPKEACILPCWQLKDIKNIFGICGLHDFATHILHRFNSPAIYRCFFRSYILVVGRYYTRKTIHMCYCWFKIFINGVQIRESVLILKCIIY